MGFRPQGSRFTGLGRVEVGPFPYASNSVIDKEYTAVGDTENQNLCILVVGRRRPKIDALPFSFLQFSCRSTVGCNYCRAAEG